MFGYQTVVVGQKKRTEMSIPSLFIYSFMIFFFFFFKEVYVKSGV